MTNDQEQHLSRVKDAFTSAVDAKYRKGVAEHGGNLWKHASVELLDMALEEVVDQWTYLYTLREQRLALEFPKPPL